MLTVFCTKVGEGEFAAFDVNALYLMVRNNLKVEHKFVCTTDNPEGILPEVEIHQPARKCWGWWNKAEGYGNPEWCEGTAILMLDLDIVITGDVTKLDRKANKFCFLRDFNYLIGNPSKIFANTYACGISYIPPGGMPELWERSKTEFPPESRVPIHPWVTKILRAQNIDVDLWQDVEPGLICSYKWPKPKVVKPPEPLVCFHGPPRPRQAISQAPWIGETYKTLEL